MRHHKKNRKLGRIKKVRKGLLSSLSLSLIERKKIQTTEAKAKEVRPLVEKMISFGKRKELHSKRMLISKLGEKGALKVSNLSDKYKDRNGGYVRIVKLPKRLSDGAPMAIVELVE